jgi:hypothetical protein
MIKMLIASLLLGAFMTQSTITFIIGIVIIIIYLLTYKPNKRKGKYLDTRVMKKIG